MHGRKKSTISTEQAAATATKMASLRKLTHLAIKHRNAHATEPEAAKLNADLLGINPDIYSLWSFRREAFCAKIDTLPVEDGAARRALVSEELRVSQGGIVRNAKSYPAWHHRAWVVRRHADLVSMPHELALCAKLLDADERNFHCWGYRSFVVALAHSRRSGSIQQRAPSPPGVVDTCVTGAPSSDPPTTVVAPADAAAPPAAAGADAPVRPVAAKASASGVSGDEFSPESELVYSLEKIKKNFSNYSAWHYRSVLLSVLHGAAVTHASSGADSPARRRQPLSLHLARGEMELVQRALFTEPDDQSGWFYHRWLVDRVRDSADDAAAGEAALGSGASLAAAVDAAAILAADARILLQLLAAEETSKWPLLGLAHLFQAAASSQALASGLLAVQLPVRGRGGRVEGCPFAPDDKHASFDIDAVIFACAPPATVTTMPSAGCIDSDSRGQSAAVLVMRAAAATAALLFHRASALDPMHAACYAALACTDAHPNCGPVVGPTTS